MRSWHYSVNTYRIAEKSLKVLYVTSKDQKTWDDINLKKTRDLDILFLLK